MFRAPHRTGRTPGGRQARFPGFDVLDEVRTWDPVTAGVVLARLGPPPRLRFFTVEEQATAGALFDQLLAQWDEPRVPILAMVDARLAEDETDGWRYADMPEDGPAWRDTLRFLDEDARAEFGRRFCECSRQEQGDLVQGVQDAVGGDWHGLPAKHVWSLWTRYACAAFYSHPWAWNEIGFGGPAYPRGYKHMGLDAREPWEVADHAPHDPTSWGDRVEEAKRRHAEVARRLRERRGTRS